MSVLLYHRRQGRRLVTHRTEPLKGQWRGTGLRRAGQPGGGARREEESGSPRSQAAPGTGAGADQPEAVRKRAHSRLWREPQGGSRWGES